MNLIQCAKCLAEKASTEFGIEKRKKNGLCSWCKDCMRAQSAIHRKAKKEQYNAQRRANYTPEQGRRYFLKQVEKPGMREALSKRVSEYQKANKEALRPYKAMKAAERSRKLTRATPAWADREKMLELYRAADFLGMVTGEWYHVDHIVPLQSNIVCGLHCQQNLQVLPASDNIRKSNRFWPDMP